MSVYISKLLIWPHLPCFNFASPVIGPLCILWARIRFEVLFLLLLYFLLLTFFVSFMFMQVKGTVDFSSVYAVWSSIYLSLLFFGCLSPSLYLSMRSSLLHLPLPSFVSFCHSSTFQLAPSHARPCLLHAFLKTALANSSCYLQVMR